MKQSRSGTGKTQKDKYTEGSGALAFAIPRKLRAYIEPTTVQFSSTDQKSPFLQPTMFAAQKLSFWFMLIFLVLISFWVAAALAASRPLPPVPADKQGSSAYFLHSRWGSKQLEEKIGKEGFRGVDTLGSRPPSCDRKCGGCFPCQPTQVPATSDRFRVQYSNYEPEGWKCKCGTSLYNP